MRTLFRGASVLDMRRGAYARKTDVLTENGRISAVGESLPAAGAKVVECGGRYLLPSLFDAHAHFTNEEMAYQCIACGVTGVRHLSGGEKPREFDRDVRAGKRVGPYVYASGPIIDGADAPDKRETHLYVATPDEAERAVRDTVKAGYLWVKNYPSLTREELKRLIDTANSLGIRVSGHMSYVVDARELADWGYACCEHASSLPKDDEAVDYIAKAGMWFCPTQVVCETLPDYVWNGKRFSDLEHIKYVPEKTRARWERVNEEIIAGYKKRGLRPDISVIIRRGRRFMESSSRYMAGSDAPYPGIIAGFALHEEIHKLVSLYGRTPVEALRAATLNPAEYMGLSGRKGLIEADMDSDLLLLDADPLADIQNTLRIAAVMQGERLYERAELDGMLDMLADPQCDFEVLAPLF